MKKLIALYKASLNRPKPEGWVQRYPDIPDRTPVDQLPFGWFFIPMFGLLGFVMLLGLAVI